MEIVWKQMQKLEMAKLTENASRDIGIAFANELSMICDSLNIDVWELIDLANKHPRVNIFNLDQELGGIVSLSTHGLSLIVFFQKQN